MTLAEFRQRRQSGEHFLSKVLAGNLITLWGFIEQAEAA
jgi:hypothetical protein